MMLSKQFLQPKIELIIEGGIVFENVMKEHHTTFHVQSLHRGLFQAILCDYSVNL